MKGAPAFVFIACAYVQRGKLRFKVKALSH